MINVNIINIPTVFSMNDILKKKRNNKFKSKYNLLFTQKTSLYIYLLLIHEKVNISLD